MGRYCSYLLPKQGGGTSQIQVNKTQSTRTGDALYLRRRERQTEAALASSAATEREALLSIKPRHNGHPSFFVKISPFSSLPPHVFPKFPPTFPHSFPPSFHPALTVRYLVVVSRHSVHILLLVHALVNPNLITTMSSRKCLPGKSTTRRTSTTLATGLNWQQSSSSKRVRPNEL